MKERFSSWRPRPDLSRYRGHGREVDALFGQLLRLSDRVHAALDAGDAERVLAVIRERNATIRRVQPLMQELLDARVTLAGGSCAPADTAAIIDILREVSHRAGRVQETDRRLAARLASERQRIAGEIERLEGNANSA